MDGPQEEDGVGVQWVRNSKIVFELFNACVFIFIVQFSGAMPEFRFEVGGGKQGR